MTVTQQEYNARMERFKKAMQVSCELNVCQQVGPCAGGCIGRVNPPAVQLRCPAIPATPEQLAQARREYDAAFESLNEAELPLETSK